MTRLGRYLSGAVLLAVLVALALLCHGCAAYKYPPDELCSGSGAWVFHRESACGAITGPLLCHNIDRVLAAGLQMCPPERRDDLRSDFAGLRVTYYGFPVRCGGHPAYGCQDGYEIALADGAAVFDETAHVVFERCIGRTGERRDAAGLTYDADFQQFVVDLRDADGGA